MKLVQKKIGVEVTAFQLRRDSDVIIKLIDDGKIKTSDWQTFEVFSQETMQGQSGCGERAQIGDYIKIDAEGFPYPNSQEWFEKNHRQITANRYIQEPKILSAWDADEPMCDEISFLENTGRLTLNWNDPERFMAAELWGTMETAARDAVIIFYSVSRDDNGDITDIDFNFVKKTVFDQTYRII